jgi:hypothetical protein
MKILNLMRALVIELFVKITVVAKMLTKRDMQIKTGHVSHEREIPSKKSGLQG